MKKIKSYKPGPKGIPLEIFLKRLKNEVGDEYAYISNYTGMTNGKIKIKHNKCGRIYEVYPYRIFSSGNRCPYCKINRATTLDEFLEKFKNKYGRKFKYISGYKSLYGNKIKIKCTRCGIICDKYYPADFIRKEGFYFCPECDRDKINNYSNMSEKDFIKYLKVERNNEYEYISDYKNYSSPCKIKHLICGSIFDGYPYKLLTNTIERRSCPVCSKRPKTISKEEFLKRFKDTLDDEYTYISGYIRMTAKCKVKHNKCGKIFEVEPGMMLNSLQTRCPYCIKNSRVTEEELAKRIKNITNGEYEYISGYNTVHNGKIKILHKKCNHIFEMVPHNFINCKQRCSFCMDKVRLSRGEVKIAKWLDKHDFLYYKQYKVEGCNYKDNLRFDFMLPSNKGNIFCLIEFDGKQHYLEGSSDFYKLDLIKKRDKIKNKFCKKNNIKLLRIPYYDLWNIENILDEYFYKYL